MKKIFIIAAVIVASLCSCSKGNKLVILAADFFTESDRAEPALYDMELNYIASFSPHLEVVAAVKSSVTI